MYILHGAFSVYIICCYPETGLKQSIRYYTRDMLHPFYPHPLIRISTGKSDFLSRLREIPGTDALWWFTPLQTPLRMSQMGI